MASYIYIDRAEEATYEYQVPLRDSRNSAVRNRRKPNTFPGRFATFHSRQELQFRISNLECHVEFRPATAGNGGYKLRVEPLI